jgi:hypothetical protein
MDESYRDRSDIQIRAAPTFLNATNPCYGLPTLSQSLYTDQGSSDSERVSRKPTPEG